MKLLLFFGVGCALLLSGCSNLLYYPSRGLYYDYRKIKPPPEEHHFLSHEIDVHGWIFRAEKPKATFVFFHGNGQNRSAHFLSVYWLVLEGYNVAIFDYPGYGQTKGKPSPKTTVETAIDVIKYVRATVPDIPLIVYGHSLGGAIAARATFEVQSEIQPEILILDSTFMSYQRAARKIMSKGILTWPLQPFAYIVFSDEWAAKKVIKEFKIKTLVVHSKKDEIIPFVLGEELYAALPVTKDFWAKENNGHNQIFASKEDQVEFLKRVRDLIDKK